MLPLNFNHLYYFYVVATHGSFSRASEELRISQSAISVQIKQFEGTLERTLFNRVKSGVELTEAGQVVFEYAGKVFGDVGELRARLEEMDRRITGSIRIGTVNSIGIYMLPEFLKQFHAEYPDVKVAIELESSRELAQRVLHGRLDFAILPSSRKYDGLKCTVLTTNKLFLVAPPDHPLVSKSKLAPSDLERYPFLGYEEGMQIRGMMDGLFRRMALSIDYVMESSNVATIKHMVLAGVGLAVLPEIAVGAEIREGRLERLHLPSLYLAQEITIHNKTHRELGPARGEFLKLIRDYFAPKHPLKR